MPDTDMHHALARFRCLIVSYGEDNPEAMPRRSGREWQRILEQAAGDAIGAGATSEDLQEIQDAYP